jgi:hypothetical protein
VEQTLRAQRLKKKLKRKQNKSYSNNSKAVKGICKNSVTPSKAKPENHGNGRRRRGTNQSDM